MKRETAAQAASRIRSQHALQVRLFNEALAEVKALKVDRSPEGREKFAAACRRAELLNPNPRTPIGFYLD